MSPPPFPAPSRHPVREGALAISVANRSLSSVGTYSYTRTTPAMDGRAGGKGLAVLQQRYKQLRDLGLKVVPVEDLKRDVAFVRNLDIGLIRADLSPERHDQALDWLLTRRLSQELPRR